MPSQEPEHFENLDLSSKEFNDLEQIASKVLQFSVYGTSNHNLNTNIFESDLPDTKLEVDEISASYDEKEKLLNFDYHRIRLMNLKKCAQNSGLNVLKLLRDRVAFFKLYKKYDSID